MTKFKNLAYSKDEEVFLFYTTFQIQRTSKKLIGRELTSVELIVLRQKTFTEVENLILKIESSGIGNEKED